MRQYRLVLLILGVSAYLPGCGGGDADPEPVVRPVRYQAVYSTGADRVRSFSGVAEAGMESKLSFKVSGTIRKVEVKVGDQVEAGQLLIELDPEDHDLQVQEAQAATSRSEAESRNAEADYGRVRALYENRNASRNDLDAARAASESAKAQVRSAQKRLELARLQRSYTRLSAPVAGAIAAVDVEQNENVTPGQPAVLLTAGSEIEVKVSVPGALIATIREGDQAKVIFDAFPDQSMDAVVTEVGGSATGGATTYPVAVNILDAPESVRPGMSARVNLRFASSSTVERYLVPPGAVGEDRQGRFVFLVETTEAGFGIARRHEVRVGDLTDDGLEIVSGLADGDLLVTAGVTKIEDGRRVRLASGS